MIITYIICKNEKEADALSLALLKKKLAACTNFFPIKSRYIWKGKLVKDTETLLLAKTTTTKKKKLQELVRKLHNYDISCIAFINADENKEYTQWMLSHLT